MKNHSKQITEEQKSYNYGCVMIEFDDDTTDQISTLQEYIPDEYIYEDDDIEGIESNIHMTIKYGLKIENFDQFPIDIPFRLIPIMNLDISAINYFEHENYDVLKLEVVPRKIFLKLREYIETKWECMESYPTYSPHITLAYLKKGYAKKFIEDADQNNYNIPLIATTSKFVISLPSKVKLSIPH